MLCFIIRFGAIFKGLGEEEEEEEEEEVCIKTRGYLEVLAVGSGSGAGDWAR